MSIRTKTVEKYVKNQNKIIKHIIYDPIVPFTVFLLIVKCFDMIQPILTSSVAGMQMEIACFFVFI